MVTEEQAQRMWEELAGRYRLEWGPAQVRDVKLELLQIKDLDEFLVGNIEAGNLSMANFPYWAMVWEGALVLADFLVRQPPDPARSILEVGAGLGFVGLFAAARGHRICLTDNHPDALDFARLSAHHNGLTTALVQELDWRHPELAGQYDWVVGSDVLYETASLAPLAALLEVCLAPGGTVYFSHSLKGPSARQFFGMVKGRFQVRYQEKKVRTEEGEKKVLFFELRRPG